MSGYSAGEALLLTAIQAHASYSSDNASRSDWGILDNGKAASYVVLVPGPYDIMRASLGGGLGASTTATERRTYHTRMYVYQAYTDEPTSVPALLAVENTVETQVNKWRFLADTGSTILDAYVTGAGEIDQIQMRQNGPFWLRRIMNVEWIEEVTITYSE